MVNNKSRSWIELAPLKSKYGNLEDFEDYYARIKLKKEFSHIPRSVFEQWLWAHHDKEPSINNYGWLDYMHIEFKLCTWTNNQLTNIYVIQEYKNYYMNRASYDNFNSFCCGDSELNEWKTYGTWRTPPIIIDVNSINGDIPEWFELKPPYQLVEGHSRLGYLHSMFTIDRLGKGQVAKKHKIYFMSIKSTNA